ncbi:MAG: YIP1 family protein [Gammaproteobacteria bacterium]|jgi:hypothetical protein|nr:YIP1 family protein [Gammaproteobacteria bacterium]
MRLRDLFPLARDSVADPRGGLRRLTALDLDRGTLWLALAAVTATGVLMTELMLRLLQRQGLEPMFTFGTLPLTTAALEFVMLSILVFAIFWIGRMLGGSGSLDHAILAMVWLQFIMACLQALQLLAMVTLPFLAGVLGLAGVALFFWLLTGFVAELHGFRSRPRVFAGIIIALLALATIAVFLLTLSGVALPEFANV